MSASDFQRAAEIYRHQAALAREANDLLSLGAASTRLGQLFQEKRELTMELKALEAGLLRDLQAKGNGDPDLDDLSKAQNLALEAEDLLCRALEKLEKSKKMSEHFDQSQKSMQLPGKSVDIEN